MISPLDIFAGVAFFITDVSALLSMIGSAIVFLGTAIAAVLGRRFRAPEKILMWSVGGLLSGTAGLLLLTFSTQFPAEPSLWLGYSRATIGWLLFLSFLLVVASKILASKTTQSSNHSGPRKVARRNPL